MKHRADMAVKFRRAALPFLGAAAGMVMAAACSFAAQAPDKDQDRIGGPAAPSPAPPLLKGAPDLLSPDGAPPPGEDGAGAPAPSYDYLIEDVPDVEAVELKPDIARKALDAFAAIHGKYDDKGIENYGTLQEFADKTEAGKQMQEEIRKFGFKNVAEWNRVIMNIGFAYSSILEGSDETIAQQIRDVENDTRMEPGKRERILKNLRALIPSANNREIVKTLMADPAYKDKLGLLDEEE